MKIRYVCVSALISLIGFVATQAYDAKSQDLSSTAPPLTTNKKIAMGTTNVSSTGFALNLFSRAYQQKKDVLVSPFSAFCALSMAFNGADGNTKKQMAQVLGVSSTGIAELNKRNKELMLTLNSNKLVQMEVANALYANKSTPFLNEFIELCKNDYSAEIHSQEFNEKTVREINAWCDTKTHGKITKILDSLTPDEKMVLLNAIYFKGSWKKQFVVAATVDDTFNSGSGEKKPIKMMNQHEKQYPYFKGDKFSSVALPYSGEGQSMYIFLPDPGVNLSALQVEFNEANWKSWMTKYTGMDVNLSLPKFKIEYSCLLNDTLKAMGMSDAFDGGTANFSKMCNQPTWISRVLQKTYMDVNEQGTEAAAVTAVVMATRAVMMKPPEEVRFRVDRPFILALVDNGSNEILFIGSVSELNNKTN